MGYLLEERESKIMMENSQRPCREMHGCNSQRPHGGRRGKRVKLGAIARSPVSMARPDRGIRCIALLGVGVFICIIFCAPLVLSIE